MFRKFAFLFGSGLALFTSLFSKSLSISDIHPIQMQMLAYHVENNSLKPELIQRSFKLYIEQFDPHHTYLLKVEVKEFLEMSDRQATAVMERVRNRDYSDYERLNKVIQASVRRARDIRSKAIDTYISRGQTVSPTAMSHGYAHNMTELTKTIQAQVALWMAIEAKGPHYAYYTEDERVKALNIWERRQQRLENPYLYLTMNGVPMTSDEVDHHFSEHYLKAFAPSLDSHTNFFSREEVTGMRMQLHKQFQGIGVIIRESGKGPYIADMVNGGPAHRSEQITPGDLIVAIDGDRLEGLEFDKVTEKLDGRTFSKIVLTLKKPNEANEYDVVLRREKITMDDQRLKYEAQPFGNGIIGIISFDSFYDNGRGVSAEKDLRHAIAELKKKGDLKGIVLDIRGNPGGFLTQAVKIAGLFVPRGVIAIAKYSNGEIEYSRDLDGRQHFEGPLVVLTSKGSASASEVIAQALQDYNAAVIVGDRVTYGKGTMQYQNITDPRAPHFFKITVGRYYTISGRTPQLEGVKSDIIVQSEYAPYNIGEKYLDNPVSRDHLGFSFTDPNSPLKVDGSRGKKELYSSFFPKQRLKYKAMIPQLRENSERRLSQNADYQAFLQKIEALRSNSGQSHDILYGLDDLQLKESILIVKDMVIINESN